MCQWWWLDAMWSECANPFILCLVICCAITHWMGGSTAAKTVYSFKVPVTVWLADESHDLQRCHQSSMGVSAFIDQNCTEFSTVHKN